MSYSRWSNSYWYTFWCDNGLGLGKEDRDTASFCICRFMEKDIIFSSKELRDDLEKCLEKVRSLEPRAKEHEIQELSIYMERFLLDVDEEYPLERKN